MRTNQERMAAVLAAVIAATAGMRVAEATTVFSDNLTASSSTVGNNSTTLTSTTTNYDIASNKAALSSNITAGSGLQLILPATTGGLVEAQGLFTGTPLSLTNVGDYVDMTVTFKVSTGTPMAAYFGLYSSGSSKPATDLANAGLSSSLTNDVTGGVAPWQGYEINLQNAGSSPKIQARSAQTSSSNINQDLVGANASISYTYPNPVTLGSSTAPLSTQITTGNTYTEDFNISVTAPAAPGTPIQYAFTSNLYSGNTATGTPLVTTTGSDPHTSNGTTTTPLGYDSFDGFAMGFRVNNAAASELDYSSLTISSNLAQQQLLDGDANGDNHVDLNDLNIVLNNLGVTSSKRSDGNFDGAPTIDLNDLNDVLNHLGTSLTPTAAEQVSAAQLGAATAAPEPASLAVLAVGGVLLMKRRHGVSRGG